MPRKPTSNAHDVNRQTVEQLSDMLGRLRETGALAGRLEDRVIVRRDHLSKVLGEELGDWLSSAQLIYKTGEWSGSLRPFPSRSTYQNWIFIRCASLQANIYVGHEDPQIEIPFEAELRSLLLAIKPPKHDAVQALLKLCESDAWFELNKVEIGQALRDWFNRSRDSGSTEDDEV